VLVIVPYDTVEEDVVVCTDSDAERVPTTTPQLTPWPRLLGRFRGESSCGGRSRSDADHKSAHSSLLSPRSPFLKAFWGL
jgi:hypothetical protein